MQRIHFKILKGFLEKGFDRTRPAVGICVKYLSEQGKKDLLEHNHRFTKGNKLLPPVNGEAMYGSLACSHLNMALRCIQAGLQSPAGDLQDLMDDTGNLKDVVLNGHKWWVLPETVPAERQVDISLWRNMDHNENQATPEIEILQIIRVTCEALSKKQAKITHGGLMASAARRNPAKLSAATLQTLSKYFIGFLENGAVDLVEDLVDFHSFMVDPKELTASTTFFTTLTQEESLSKCPITRMSLVISQYCTEKIRTQAGGPAVSQFLVPKRDLEPLQEARPVEDPRESVQRA